MIGIGGNGTSFYYPAAQESVCGRCQMTCMKYHSHENCDEVWVGISGVGQTIVDGTEQEVRAGDVVTIRAGSRHTVVADSELKLMEVRLGREISVHDKQKYKLEYYLHDCADNQIPGRGR